MAGGMEVKKNKFVEDWGAARENLEQNFRWSRRNLALCGIFGLLVPYLVYKGTVRDFIYPLFVNSISKTAKLLRQGAFYTVIQLLDTIWQGLHFWWGAFASVVIVLQMLWQFLSSAAVVY